MKITLVKKILADGSPCAKCADVQAKLDSNHQMQFIDATVIADERDSTSPGMQLAAKYQVDRAPFFIVERADQDPQIYTVYLKFVKEILNQAAQEKDELKEIMENNQDLDFL